MERYGKTPGPFKRSPKSNKIIFGEWSDPILEYLQDANFIFTEKLDGTNMRLIYHPEHTTTTDGFDSIHHPARLELRGRSDAAAVHPRLREWVEGLDIEPFVKAFSDNQVCIYGEGVGDGIQNGGPQYGHTHFRAFGIKGSRGWLSHQVTREILTHGLNLDQVPWVTIKTLNQGIKIIQAGLASQFGDGKFMAEGMVGLPLVLIYTPNQERIIVKIKHRDFYLGD